MVAEGLRSLVLRSGCVVDGVVGRKGWVSGGQVGIHRVSAEVRSDSWILDPWCLPCVKRCNPK